MSGERPRLFGWAVIAVVLAQLHIAYPAAAASLRLAQTVTYPRGELFIDTNHGPQRFEIEIARTDAQRSRGLMYRVELAPDAGMLFVYDPVREVSMWMRNTFVALDMLFIAADGRIVGIAANTTPLSEETISSGMPVRAVLELSAGAAARFGIRAGDRVRADALAMTR